MKSKIKVVHLNAASAGGAYTAAQRLVEALNLNGEEIEAEHWVFEGGRGHQPSWANNIFKRVIAFGYHAIEKLDFLRFEKDKSVRFAFSHGLTGVDASAWKAVKTADIIHLHWVNKGFLSFKSFEKLLELGKPVVWTCHDLWPFTGGCYWGCENIAMGCGNCGMLKQPSEKDLSWRVFHQKERLWGARSRYFLKQSEVHSATTSMQFVFPSSWLMDQAKLSSISIGKHLERIPNVIDTNFFKPAESNARMEIRKRLGFSENKLILLFAAANISDKRKGFSDFLKIVEHLDSGKVEVAVVGRNDKFQGELPGNVKLLGFHSDKREVLQFFQMADLFVTTAKEENLPTTIIESLSCGTPVGAYSVGGIPQMVDDGITGFLATKGDWETLKLKIEEMLNDSFTIKQTRAVKCRETAIEQYSSDAVVGRYLKVYQNAITGNN